MIRDRAASVLNLDDAARARPASEVLADVNWDGQDDALDPTRVRAVEYLAWLVAAFSHGEKVK